MATTVIGKREAPGAVWRVRASKPLRSTSPQGAVKAASANVAATASAAATRTLRGRPLVRSNMARQR